MKNIKKVLIIGSGPIIIGQAAEFDYSGTQASLACREEGVKTIIVNSNPATIQTDYEVADIIYIEPLTVNSLEKIIKIEKPDGIIITVGGQTSLNLGTELFKLGILKKYKVKILGTDTSAIKRGEDRAIFKNLMEKIHQPVLPAKGVKNIHEAKLFSESIGFPAIIRSAYNLGGTGSGIAKNTKELIKKVKFGLSVSPIGQVLIEKSVLGWEEFEYEIIRDQVGNTICICNMENIDPMGVHTGESIVVAPSQTLSNNDHQMLRTAAEKIVEAIKIKGACNIQFAFNKKTGDYYVVEVNPRLSRSSALASKATGYPIAKVATKIALGKTLPEITNDITGKTAFFEPALDYVVIKIPRWPDDKFLDLNKEIGLTMKSTGEVMAIGRSFEEAMYKAIESLDIKPARKTTNSLETPNTQRLTAIFQAFKNEVPTQKIASITNINPWFIEKLKSLHQNKKRIASSINVYKMVDTCAGEFEALTPYFYSTHGDENEAKSLKGPKVIILGAGPIRIGQGIEFDYLTVHAVKAIREMGIKAIVINNNPETVSTDYSISDRLYFEPLTPDFVLKIIENEKKELLGVIPAFGGQTAINLVSTLHKKHIKILGSQSSAIDAAENRSKTAELIKNLGIKMPDWKIANSKAELKSACKNLGFPVLIRPSFVLGGEGMIIAKKQKNVDTYLKTISKEAFKNPILVDSFLENALEIDVDFLADKNETVSFILEQLEPAGIHSGDSRSVYPPQITSTKLQKELREITHNIAQAFKIIGIGNLQCAIKNNQIYILEINPRASRTVPFLSKCLGVSLPEIAIKIMLGEKLKNQKIQIQNHLVAIKSPVFSFQKLENVSTILGPLMKSTGEAMSVGRSFNEALLKSQLKEKPGHNLKVYRLRNSR